MENHRPFLSVGKGGNMVYLPGSALRKGRQDTLGPRYSKNDP